MISPVSFGSTYKMSLDANSKNIINYYATLEFCDSQEIPCIDNYEGRYCTMVSPDSKDKYLETYMANKGIEFVKLDPAKLMDPRMINARVMRAPKDMHKVMIDAEKFDKLAQNTGFNYEHCKSDYDKYYKEILETQLKSGEPISATSVYFTPQGLITDMVIEEDGADKLDKCYLSTTFNMSHNTEDSSMYFAMKDAGMKEIPVYMNRESLELARKIGILAK